MKFYRGEYVPLNPKFAAGSPAGYSENIEGPVPADSPPITYSKEDDMVIDDWIRSSGM
jgi:hypothetical protein